ncbi:biopolymer transporter ExbD [bacterium]|nr:biopolymer transporter ExbD [bacterium]
MILARKRLGAKEVPMASSADIAFLLLIFFLITTTIDIDRGIRLVLPARESQPIRPKNIANLLINAGGEALLDGQPVELTDLNRVIKQRLQANPNLIVSVKTDRKTRYSAFIHALDELKITHATRISLAESEN